MMNSIINNTWIQEIKNRYQKLEITENLEKAKHECSKCNDRGYTLNANDEVVWCECKIKREQEERLKKFGISDRVKENTFKNYKQDNEQRSRAVETCLEFLKNFKVSKPSLIFMGEVGAGKTHLAIATCNKLLSKYYVKYVLYETIRELKFSFKDRDYYHKELYKFKNVEVLFIDDLFKGLDRLTDLTKAKAELDIVYEIINYRYNNKKPVIITTELNINQLMKIDGAITSRILEMAKGYRVTFNGIELNYRIFGE